MMKELSTKIIEINKEATGKLNEYLKNNFKDEKILVVCDDNTKNFISEIKVKNARCYTFPYNVQATPEDAAELNEFDCGVMIACGAGTIHDITRYNAHERKIPFISYPTAASVDGFVSTIAAMTVDGRKKTLPSTPPIALFADPGVFVTAPIKYTVSGYCDIIGKFIALFDWKFCSLITNEPLDNEIIKLEEDAIKKLLESDLKDENFTTVVMEGLVLSGMAIQMFGSSRPASGAEHHLSHLWEMHCINNKTDALHGEKVGVATLMVLEKYKKLKNILYRPKKFDYDHLYPVFKSLTYGIIEENTPSSLLNISQKNIDDKIDEIKTLISELPEADELLKYYKKIGALTALKDIDLPDDGDFIEKTFEFAPYVRNRITLLKII